MANEVHRKVQQSITDATFGASNANLDALADGDLAWSAAITTCEDCDTIDVFVDITTGGSAPTAGNTISVFIGKADDEAGEIRAGSDDITTTSAGTETVDADVARVTPHLDLLGVLKVDATTEKAYRKAFSYPNPGADFNIFILNETGTALSSTGAPHQVHYRGWVDEVQ